MLTTVREPVRAAEPRPTLELTEPLLLIERAGHVCALSAARVSEPCELPQVRDLPGLPEWGLGLFSLDGRLLLLVELGRLLEFDLRDDARRRRGSPMDRLRPEDRLHPKDRVILLHDGQGRPQAGLTVDRILGLGIPPAELVPRNLESRSVMARASMGFLDWDGLTAELLEPDRLLRAVEIEVSRGSRKDSSLDRGVS